MTRLNWRNGRNKWTRPLIPWLKAAAAGVVLFAGGATALAADTGEGWGKWWLPPDHSTHGYQIDTLFLWTFWITMITFIAVETVLIVFLFKYRSRKDKPKAHFTHGNTRLEMCWTLAPAVIFIALAVANKGVWEGLRFNPALDKAETAKILVVGEQFKWNVVYPGPDGKLGRYMIFPHPTDTKWSDPRTEKQIQSAKGAPYKFKNVEGPAYLPYEKAVAAITDYVKDINPLGKDFSDPDGKDDDWSKYPGREINIPVNRAVEVDLSSKDVIHDFFLPNFRVKLDAVPGLRGKIAFTAKKTSKEMADASLRKYSTDELIQLLNRVDAPELRAQIRPDSPGAVKDPTKDEYFYATNPTAPKPEVIMRSGQDLSKARAAALKQGGVNEVWAYDPGYWELVCEELCGQGHYTMKGTVYVLSQDEYRAKYETPKTAQAGSSSDLAAVK